MIEAAVIALTILVPIHGALWLGIRNEKNQMRLMYKLAVAKRFRR